ncbi:MAG: hypothetical protein WC865_02395 [Bacteroidales bacterium]
MDFEVYCDERGLNAIMQKYNAQVNKKTLIAGSAFETSVVSIPRVKNDTSLQQNFEMKNYQAIEYHFPDVRKMVSKRKQISPS